MTAKTGEHSLSRQIGPVAMLFTAITSIIGSGWLFASLYATAFSLPVFWLAVATRLPDEEARAAIAQAMS